MKNKKGFTLVEIIAVIVVLAILMLIAIPNIQGAFNAANKGISNIEKRNIQDAAERAVLEVLDCDISDNTYNVFGLSNTTNCTNMQKTIINHTITSSVQKLRDNDYLDDTYERCEGNISITTSLNYTVTVDTSLVDCKTRDKTAPSLYLEVINDSYSLTKNLNIGIEDNGGLSNGTIKIYYKFSDNEVACSSMTNYVTVNISDKPKIASTALSVSSTGKEKIYICNKDNDISDINGNVLKKGEVKSIALIADKTKPSILYYTNGYNYTRTYRCTDNESGIKRLYVRRGYKGSGTLNYTLRDTTYTEFTKSVSYTLPQSSTYFYVIYCYDNFNNSSYVSFG